MNTLTKQQFKRVWFITGASRGFGALIAQAALEDGSAVVAVSESRRPRLHARCLPVRVP